MNACLCLLYPMLPVSLDCPFSIASLIFSNVYFQDIFYIKYIGILIKTNDELD